MICAICLKPTVLVDLNENDECLRCYSERMEQHARAATCGCGIYIHPAVRNHSAIHIEDCPYFKPRKLRKPAPVLPEVDTVRYPDPLDWR